MRMFLLLLWAACAPAVAHAFEPDVRRLLETRILKQLDPFGTWDVSSKGQTLHLRCTSCTNPVDLFILVRDHRASHAGGNLSQSYLAERKDYCQKLVRSGKGRCTGISKSTVRILNGHRAQAIEEGAYLSEQVVFYGGHALTAILRETDSFSYGDDMAELLGRVLLRMTPVW